MARLGEFVCRARGNDVPSLHRSNHLLFSWVEWHWLGWLIFVAVPVFVVGRWVAGKIFGWNLLLTCRYRNINHNDAFSAMKLDSHRHFLRIRILGDTLAVFPVKLDRVPKRDEWRENPARQANPFASVFVSEPAMEPKLVEMPIEIRAHHAPSTTEVKTPSQLPPKR